ncbi:hypothetical protein FB451DRAFT_1464654 [Mycena latifolia]|nr:hypothetical protein FB451DRAFT_1464654 [Mycena latifolia]
MHAAPASPGPSIESAWAGDARDYDAEAWVTSESGLGGVGEKRENLNVCNGIFFGSGSDFGSVFGLTLTDSGFNFGSEARGEIRGRGLGGNSGTSRASSRSSAGFLRLLFASRGSIMATGFTYSARPSAASSVDYGKINTTMGCVDLFRLRTGVIMRAWVSATHSVVTRCDGTAVGSSNSPLRQGEATRIRGTRMNDTVGKFNLKPQNAGGVTRRRRPVDGAYKPDTPVGQRAFLC